MADLNYMSKYFKQFYKLKVKDFAEFAYTVYCECLALSLNLSYSLVKMTTLKIADQVNLENWSQNVLLTLTRSDVQN